MPTCPARLLAGPYTPPPLRRGDRATCLFRDADVTVTSWTSAPIPWPRCCRPGTHGGVSGLLVTEELGLRPANRRAAQADGRHLRGKHPGARVALTPHHRGA